MGECKNEWRGEETNEKEKRRQDERDVRDRSTVKGGIEQIRRPVWLASLSASDFSAEILTWLTL